MIASWRWCVGLQAQPQALALHHDLMGAYAQLRRCRALTVGDIEFESVCGATHYMAFAGTVGNRSARMRATVFKGMELPIDIKYQN